jgi:hypothetical protein
LLKRHALRTLSPRACGVKIVRACVRARAVSGGGPGSFGRVPHLPWARQRTQHPRRDPPLRIRHRNLGTTMLLLDNGGSVGECEKTGWAGISDRPVSRGKGSYFRPRCLVRLA